MIDEREELASRPWRARGGNGDGERDQRDDGEGEASHGLTLVACFGTVMIFEITFLLPLPSLIVAGKVARPAVTLVASGSRSVPANGAQALSSSSSVNARASGMPATVLPLLGSVRMSERLSFSSTTYGPIVLLGVSDAQVEAGECAASIEHPQRSWDDPGRSLREP